MITLHTPSNTTPGHFKPDFRRILSQRLCTVAAIMALLGLPSAWAQNAGSGLSSELAPLAAKYQADMDALALTRDKALAPSRQSYLTALAAAEQKAASENKTDEAKAAADETVAVTGGSALDGVPSPLLPRALTTPRAYLLRETTRVEHEYNVRAQQIGADYLRGLAFYENRVRAAGQTDLLKQIEAEKLKVAGSGAGGALPGHGAGHELVTNGDFAKKKPDGTPETWTHDGPGKGAAATEQNTTFLQLTSSDRKETWFVEVIDHPIDARELQVTVRLRCPDMRAQGTYGVVIIQRDAGNRQISRDSPCVLKSACPAWKSLSGVVTVHPETKKFSIRCSMVDSVTTADFADVHVEAR